MDVHAAPADWLLWVGLAGAVLSLLTAIIGFLVGLLLVIVGWIFNQNQMRLQRSQDSAWSEIRQMKERNAQFSHVNAGTIALKSDLTSSFDQLTRELSGIESAFNMGFAKFSAEIKEALALMLPRAEFDLHQKLIEQRLADIARAAGQQGVLPPAGTK
jgi:hypothetical protein